MQSSALNQPQPQQQYPSEQQKTQSAAAPGKRLISSNYNSPMNLYSAQPVGSSYQAMPDQSLGSGIDK